MPEICKYIFSNQYENLFFMNILFIYGIGTVAYIFILM